MPTENNILENGFLTAGTTLTANTENGIVGDTDYDTWELPPPAYSREINIPVWNAFDEECDEEEDTLECTCASCVRYRSQESEIDRTVERIILDEGMVLDPMESQQLREIVADRLRIERAELNPAQPRFGMVDDRTLRRQQADLVAQDREEDDFKLEI